jgi:hypothetical protein
VYRRLGNSFISLPFPHNALLESPIDLASRRQSRRPCSINSFSASQAEAIDMEILLSSQGSRIVNMERSSIVYSFLVRAHNLQILRIEQGSTPRIDRSIFAALLFVAFASTKRCTLSFSRFAPRHSRLFRPLSPIVIKVTTVRHHDVALPPISATVFMTPRSRELTLLSSVLSTPDTRLGQLTVATRSDYKMEPFTGTADTKAPSPSELSSITVLFLLLASLVTCH